MMGFQLTLILTVECQRVGGTQSLMYQLKSNLIVHYLSLFWIVYIIYMTLLCYIKLTYMIYTLYHIGINFILFYHIVSYLIILFYIIFNNTVPYMYFRYVWVRTCVACPILAVYLEYVNVCSKPYGWLPWLMYWIRLGRLMMQQLNYIYSGESWQCNKDDNTKSSICLLQTLQK